MRLTVVIPVLNEEIILANSVKEVYARLQTDFPDDDFLLVVVDNGSSDGTRRIVEALLTEFPRLRYERLEARGKGLGIRTGWQRHPADVNVFMDADLATDLGSLRPLVNAISQGADVAVGSRFHRASTVTRSAFRRLFSNGFRLVTHYRLGLKVSDATCGFKAVSRRVLKEIVPTVRNDRWFFDTELVARAEWSGLKVVEVPVVWKEEAIDGRRSRVNVFKVSWQYWQEVKRLAAELR